MAKCSIDATVIAWILRRNADVESKIIYDIDWKSTLEGLTKHIEKHCSKEDAKQFEDIIYGSKTRKRSD